MDRSISRRENIQLGGLVLATAAAGCIGTLRSTGDGSDTGTDDQAEDSSRSPVDDDGSGPNSSADTTNEPDPGLFDDFEDLSKWSSIGGTVTADSDRSLIGTQSVRIDVRDDDVRGAIHRQFDPPLDITNRRPQLGVTTQERLYPRIRVTDDDGHWLRFRSYVQDDLPFQYYDFGIEAVEGDPDLSRIVDLRIDTYVGSGASRTLWYDGLRFGARPDPGVVVLMFDDSLETDYTRGYPLLEEHDMVASTFINPGYLGREVGGHDRLSVTQLDDLHDAGWDICSHGMNHHNLTSLSDETRESEVREAYNWLLDHGFERGADYFTYPYSSYDVATFETVSQYHDHAFAGGYPAVGRSMNPYLVHRSSGDPTADEAIADIDVTATYGGYTILFYHKLTDERYSALVEIVSHLDSLRARGRIEVQSVSQVGDALLDEAGRNHLPF